MGFILALSSGLCSISKVRSFIRIFCPNVDDSAFDMALIILLIVGLSVTTVKYYIDQKEIKTLEKEVDLFKYQEISQYNAMGNKAGKVNGVNMVSTPINDWNIKYAYFDNGQIKFRCEPGAKEVCREVIAKMPSYPFSYYFLAKRLKEEKDSSWVEMAQTAKAILQKTTQIPGHKTDHDNALKEVTNLLK
jgi:hypothetical protein